MPNARMADDGMLSFTFAAMENTQRFNFDFQVLPWFEATFRYGHLSGSGGFVDYHRNLGFKMRLFEESDYMPDISLGVRDLIGTGRQGAEYLVATKAIENFDVTAGVGWGRLSDNQTFPNLLAKIFPSFETRPLQPTTGGTPAFGQLFHGPYMGVFGGIDWRSPIEGLDLIAEYSSDKYVIETGNHVMKVRSPVNVGVSYSIFDNLRIAAGWLYGSTYGAMLTYAKNPGTTPFAARIGPPEIPPHIRTDEQQVAALTGLRNRNLSGLAPAQRLSQADRQQQSLDEALFSEARGVRHTELDGKTLLIEASYYEDASAQCEAYARVVEVSADAAAASIALTDPNDPSGSVSLCPVAQSEGTHIVDAGMSVASSDEITRRIRADVESQQLELDALAINGTDAWLYYRNQRYRLQTQAAGRLVRVLLKDAPPQVEVFHLILVQHGVAIREIQIARSAMERAMTVSGSSQELGEALSLKVPSLDQPVLNAALASAEPRFSWSIGPGIRPSFFDPNAPVQVEIEAVASANLELSPGLDLAAEADANIWNNFDLKTPSASDLPHVRSDITQYLKHGINGIGQLELDYRYRITPEVYSIVRAGYLEDMFAGVGGQILWRPEGQRFALGVDVYQVWKRNFDRLFGVQSYHILTGHVTLYYNSPWYGLNFNLHAGRYLAGDYGGTIEITRRFETGVEIGAFATFTNVPFSKFGEGSFDKGFLLRIPFEWSLPIYTQTAKATTLHSLTRDGGQRLQNDDPLYPETRDASYGDLLESIDEITDPR
jgi:hypothetical protein